PCGAQDPLAVPVSELQDLDARGLGHVRRVAVGQRLVHGRVEGLALLPVRAQAQLGEGGLQQLGHLGEAANELAVLTRPADVVEHGQELVEHAADGLLPDQRLVPLDSLAVVAELRLDALEVRRPLREKIRDLRIGRSRRSLRAAAGLLVLLLLPLLRGGLPGLPGLRIDLPLIADDRPLLGAVLARGHLLPPSRSSSTISASTTSSSLFWEPEVWPPEAAAVCSPADWALA